LGGAGRAILAPNEHLTIKLEFVVKPLSDDIFFSHSADQLGELIQFTLKEPNEKISVKSFSFILENISNDFDRLCSGFFAGIMPTKSYGGSCAIINTNE